MGTKLYPYKEQHVLAVFSQRLALQLGAGRDASRLAAEAVRGHMCILRAVTADGHLHTYVASEPMLAFAACTLLNSNVLEYTEALEGLIENLVLQGVFSEPAILKGRLFGRIALTLARDWATCKHAKRPTSPQSYLTTNGGYGVRLITLWQFLKALLGKIPEIHPMKSYAKNVWINFTHFYQLEGHFIDQSRDLLRRA
jgi:hypothetical protein